jgi:aminocarboxymuconate-semialdehyde decarboxylase
VIKVDMHSHVVPVETLGQAGPYGPELTADDDGFRLRLGKADIGGIKSRKLKKAMEQDGADPRDWLARFSDPAIRLAAMDERGIDVMGVTISPYFYMYWIDPEINVPFAQKQNDALARYCREAPDRFFFMPTLPLQDIPASLAEVDRAVGELGGKGINIAGSNINGRELGDESLWPVYEKCAQYDVPLFIHPYPTSLMRQAEGSEAVADDPYRLGEVLEYISQETVGFTTLLYSGVLDELPDLKIYITHGGGFVPYQFGRIEAMAEIVQCKARRPLRDYLKNFYFDNLVHDLNARRFLVDWMGVENIVVGDNFEGHDSADGFAFAEELGLPEDDAAKIMGANAVKLFKLDALVSQEK